VTGENLLGLPETLLPSDPAAEALTSGTPASEVVIAFPASPAAWAALADEAAAAGETLPAYAYARVGYHRGLDSLRGNGWRGQGPVPWSHEPNRGVLRALFALRRAAATIGETSEVDRLTEFLNGADRSVIATLEGDA
jgi:Protein of unknown function (DUF3151)